MISNDEKELIAYFKNRISESTFKPAYKKRLNYSQLQKMSGHGCELVPIFNSKGDGFIFLEIITDENPLIVRFVSNPMKANKLGRIKPVICDLCLTWRSGTGSSRVTFYFEDNHKKPIGLLCCRDLLCAMNIRDLTEAAKVSRAQLPENLDVQKRRERFYLKLKYYFG